MNFKDTLNLPRTDFPIRASSKIDDPEILKKWDKEDIYKETFKLNEGNKKYILHDGPPYANGDIHLGHAYNKILKDIVTKAYRMLSFHVPVIPGWDCHGLPIELKVVQANKALNKIDLKKACRDYANSWIAVQRESFKSLGVLMDWNNPYITMSFEYESECVKAFAKLVEKGFIERKNKTVPWCFSCNTVLASAEIDYKNRKDPSLYVLFDLKDNYKNRLFPEFQEKDISLVIWTTTPWTIPLNQAVLVKPNTNYILLDINGKLVITGKDSVDQLIKLAGFKKNVIKEFISDIFENVYVKHPLIDKYVPLIFEDSISKEEGTAFVHCAPGCGPIDYEIGIKNKLSIYSPITADGKYTSDIELKELENLSILDGQIWVIKRLQELGKILYKNYITHSYPHCWRCHSGLIFRATKQWFFNLEKHDIKTKALDAIKQINFIPSQGRKFLKATVESRWEWCLSRQRTWGIPIPAILCNNCDYTYLNYNVIKKVADGILKEGIEYWDNVSIDDLLGKSFKCPSCNENDLKKEFDILDVWFDSGISHYAVLYKNGIFPADIYLEGIDQHRGWFQSSLLTSLVLEEKPCTRNIMTHGYTVDSKGQKMSKSLGNVVAPNDIIDKIGRDGLRLWVSSIGNDSDPVVSDKLIENIAEVYRKIRNSIRFALSNLYDFDIEKDSINNIDDLEEIDKYAIEQLNILNTYIIKKYLELDFTNIFHKLADYVSSELSSFYFDIIKDRLYTEKNNGIKRRSAQTVLWHILDTINRLIAPILSFTSEIVSNYYNKDIKSIHLESFRSIDSILSLKREYFKKPVENMSQIKEQKRDIDQWDIIKKIRSSVLKFIELERQKGLIKHSLESRIIIYIDFSKNEFHKIKQLINKIDLKELFIVSQILFLDDSQFRENQDKLNESEQEGLYIFVEKALGEKCPRCWQWDITDHEFNLCNRCYNILFE